MHNYIIYQNYLLSKHSNSRKQKSSSFESYINREANIDHSNTPPEYERYSPYLENNGQNGRFPSLRLTREILVGLPIVVIDKVMIPVTVNDKVKVILDGILIHSTIDVNSVTIRQILLRITNIYVMSIEIVMHRGIHSTIIMHYRVHMILPHLIITIIIIILVLIRTVRE